MRRGVQQDAARVECVWLFASHLGAIGVAAAAKRPARAVFCKAKKGADAADAYVAAVGESAAIKSGTAEVTCMHSDVTANATAMSAAQDPAAQLGVAARLKGGADAIFVSDSDGEGDFGNIYGSVAPKNFDGTVATAASESCVDAQSTPAGHATTSCPQGLLACEPEFVDYITWNLATALGDAHMPDVVPGQAGDVEGSDNEAGGPHVDPTTYYWCVLFFGHLRLMESSNAVSVVG